MMRLTIEIISDGDEHQRRSIATVNISNVTERGTRDDYEAEGTTERAGSFCMVVPSHLRTLGCVPLLRRVLKMLSDRQRL